MHFKLFFQSIASVFQVFQNGPKAVAPNAHQWYIIIETSDNCED